jgi:hypothetical protein
MGHHKTKPSGRQQREREQAKRDLDQELQQYQQAYDRDHDITQKIPVISMYNLIHEGRQP